MDLLAAAEREFESAIRSEIILLYWDERRRAYGSTDPVTVEVLNFSKVDDFEEFPDGMSFTWNEAS